MPFVVLALGVLAIGVLAVPAVGGAINPHSASKLRAHDAALAAKSRAAVLDLYSLDQRLAGNQSRLTTLQTQTLSLRAQRASLTHQLRIAKRGTHLAQNRLAARLRILYEQGNVEPLEIVFGAKNLDEAMTSLESLNRASAQSESVLRELQTAKTRLSTASRSLASKQAALAAATREAAATAASLADARSRRAEYVASLGTAHRLTQRQIAGVVARARLATVRSAAIVHVPAAPYIGTPAAGRTLTVSATGYSMPGHTASGLPVGWGVVAVDPSVIPLGTHMTVPGYGSAVAADTGSGVSGATIDLWFPTVAQANAWGRRTVTIVLH